MKISDQGFTERLSSQTNKVNPANNNGNGTAASSKQQGGSPDLLQLSSIASRLQTAGSGESADSRASRVSQISQIVHSGGFRIDPSKISSALVSEAIQAAN